MKIKQVFSFLVLLPNFHFMFLGNIDPKFKIFKICLNGSSSFSAPIFSKSVQRIQNSWCPTIWDLRNIMFSKKCAQMFLCFFLIFLVYSNLYKYGFPGVQKSRNHRILMFLFSNNKIEKVIRPKWSRIIPPEVLNLSFQQNYHKHDKRMQKHRLILFALLEPYWCPGLGTWTLRTLPLWLVAGSQMSNKRLEQGVPAKGSRKGFPQKGSRKEFPEHRFGIQKSSVVLCFFWHIN